MPYSNDYEQLLREGLRLAVHHHTCAFTFRMVRSFVYVRTQSTSFCHSAAFY